MEHVLHVRACVLCGVVGAPLVALDVPVPPVSPLSSVLFPMCAMVPTLLVGSVVVVPLSLPAISDCGGVVSPELGLSSPGTESVPVAPVELQDPTSCYCWCRDVGVCGVRSGPVVLAKALATPLVLCLGSVVCSVVLSFHCVCFRRLSLSRRVSSFLPGPSAFPFALGFSRVLRPVGRGRAPLKVQMI